jgi:apolipoprotein N-acyltransferase
MVNITNDGWFGDSVRGRLMHEQAARWRCVELGLDMVRVANTGVSGLIDRQGRVVSRTAARGAGTMVVPAVPRRPGTVFARTGEWGGWLCLVAVPVLAWRGRGAGRRRNGNSDEPARPDE